MADAALPYEPPVSVWEVTRNNLRSEQEQEFMKETLGEDLVDQTVELHMEVDNLLEIWRDFRDETVTLTSWNAGAAFPEPPEVRFRLKKEIQFYVEALQRKASEEGRDLAQILRNYNNDVLDYALGKRVSSARASTGRSARDGRETPLVEAGPDDDSRGRVEMLKEAVQGMGIELGMMSLKLKSMEYVHIIDHLRDELEKEVDTLYEDISFLQSCLESESDFRCETSLGHVTEPSLSELKEERKKLERQLLEDGAGGDAFRSRSGDAFRTGSGAKPKAPPLAALAKISSSDKNSKGNPGDVPSKSSPTPRSPEPRSPEPRPPTKTKEQSISRHSTPLRAIHSPTKDASPGALHSPTGARGVSPPAEEAPLGPAARQPFGSTQRTRIRDKSPLTAKPPTAWSQQVDKTRDRTSEQAWALPSGAKLVTVASLQAPCKSLGSAMGGAGGHVNSPDSSLDSLLAPTPPPTPPNRVLSSAHASRFRKMVLECRDDL